MTNDETKMIIGGYAYEVNYRYKDEENVRSSFIVATDPELRRVLTTENYVKIDNELTRRYGLTDTNVVFYYDAYNPIFVSEFISDLEKDEIIVLEITNKIPPAYIIDELWAIIWGWDGADADFELWYGNKPTTEQAETCIAWNTGYESVEEFRNRGGTIIDIVKANKPFTFGEYGEIINKMKGAKND